MATRAEIQAKLEKIDQRKAEALKALQARRSKLKAKLAQLDRPTKSQRRFDGGRQPITESPIFGGGAVFTVLRGHP